MSIGSSFAIYFIIWWTVLFMVLPWGIRRQDDDGAEIVPGTDPGAPAVHHLGRKLIATTLIAAIVFAIYYVVYTRRLITFEQLTTFFGLLPGR